jgi:hypothetical protein
VIIGTPLLIGVPEIGLPAGQQMMTPNEGLGNEPLN